MIPNDLIPVIAQIEHLNDLGTSKWYEVVYYSDGEWHPYAGSNTFKDGEKVLQWKYCADLFNTEECYHKGKYTYNKETFECHKCGLIVPNEYRFNTEEK